ncbi:DUF6615 family protein [Rhodococcoides fascians]|uniref:DUF6615 family protein n=1 Tax=Rhodococcoides fascians TaxID=1828 RepID=UPI00056983F1|nr:DUF6615 family protein [Rhodococcus fascians]
MSAILISSIATHMDQLAIETWHKLADGDQARIKFREDSITDHNLLALHRRFGRHMSVLRYNQREEALSGADWEWWIGSDFHGWFVLRIQAKRAHGLDYSALNHKDKLTGQLQYQTMLVRTSTRPGEYAFHVFYNGWEPSRFAEYRRAQPETPDAPPWWSTSRTSRVSHWGCMGVSTQDVKELHSSVSLRKYRIPRYLERGFPWSELFSGLSPGHNAASMTNLLQFNAYRASLGSAMSTNWLAQGLTLEDLRANSVIPPGAVGRDSRIAELPAYARAALDPGSLNGDLYHGSNTDVRRPNRPPKRVTVTDLGE